MSFTMIIYNQSVNKKIKVFPPDLVVRAGCDHDVRREAGGVDGRAGEMADGWDGVNHTHALGQGETVHADLLCGHVNLAGLLGMGMTPATGEGEAPGCVRGDGAGSWIRL